MDRVTRNQSFKTHPEYEAIFEDLLWIRDFSTDHEWLGKSEDFVCRTIENGLRVDTLYFETVVTITKVMPTAMIYSDCEAWFQRVAAIVEAQAVSEDNLFQVGVKEVIASFSSLVGIYGALNDLLETEVETLLRAYIKLFTVLGWNHGSIIPHEMIDQAERVARRVQDKRLAAKLHQTIALYHVHTGDFFYAQQHAKMAYTEYEYLGDLEGSADAATTLAIALRNDWKYKQGDEYLQRAINTAKEQGYSKRYATLLYEEGVRCYRTDAFALGWSFLTDALEIFEWHKAPYQIAMTHQVMAMIDIHTGKFDEATAEIALVREIWQRIGNDFELANLCFVEADLELKRGNTGEGMRLLDVAREKSLALPETEASNKMIELINHHREKYS